MKAKTRPHQIEIRDPDDELVTHAPASVHIERMAGGHWWMRISTDTDSVVVEFASGSRIKSTMVRGE